jgi:hypothetical protein
MSKRGPEMERPTDTFLGEGCPAPVRSAGVLRRALWQATEGGHIRFASIEGKRSNFSLYVSNQRREGKTCRSESKIV